MAVFADQTGQLIHLDRVPERVVSLVPSQSEFLWDTGIQNELVGITKFCIHPHEMFRKVERVGGTKNLDMEKIRKLKPDLIIANKEENDREQVRALQSEFNVWISDVNDLNDAVSMMETIGAMFRKQEIVRGILDKLKPSLERSKYIFNGVGMAYFMWNDPYMCAAGNTFIHSVLLHAGFKNVFGNLVRYPVITTGQLQDASPSLCFLSSEPFPFSEKHAGKVSKLLPGSKVMLVDGEIFSWYGTRLLKLENYLVKLKKELML